MKNYASAIPNLKKGSSKKKVLAGGG